MITFVKPNDRDKPLSTEERNNLT